MSFALKLNKSKQISFRINPKGSGVDFILTLPGITLTLTKKTSKRKASTTSKGNHYPVKKIANASIRQFQPAKYRSLLSKISTNIRLNTIANWLIPTLLLFAILRLPLPLVRSYLPSFIVRTLRIVFAATGVLGIAIKIYVHTIGRVSLADTIDSAMNTANAKESFPWQELMNPDMLWQVVGIAQLPPEEQRENAGRAVWYERVPVKRKAKAPFYLRKDTDALQLKLEKETLILTPICYLLVRNSKVGIMDVADVTYTTKATPYGETEALPKDVDILHYTWKYVNKDGSKDKRYKDNEQLPICNYGLIQLESASGFRITLLSSAISRKAQSEVHLGP